MRKACASTCQVSSTRSPFRPSFVGRNQVLFVRERSLVPLLLRTPTFSSQQLLALFYHTDALRHVFHLFMHVSPVRSPYPLENGLADCRPVFFRPWPSPEAPSGFAPCSRISVTHHVPLSPKRQNYVSLHSVGVCSYEKPQRVSDFSFCRPSNGSLHKGCEIQRALQIVALSIWFRARKTVWSRVSPTCRVSSLCGFRHSYGIPKTVSTILPTT